MSHMRAFGEEQFILNQSLTFLLTVSAELVAEK